MGISLLAHFARFSRGARRGVLNTACSAPRKERTNCTQKQNPWQALTIRK